MSQEKSRIVEWAQVASTILIGVVGAYFTFAFQEQQQHSQAQMTVMQLLSQREHESMDLRQKQFAFLDEKLLNTRVPLGNRLGLLRLFQGNFHGVLNVRFVFDALELEAEKAPASQRGHLMADLVSIAEEVTREQLQILRLLGVQPHSITMTPDEEMAVDLKFGGDAGHKEEVQLHNDDHHIKLTVKKILDRAVRVTARIDKEEIPEFEVSYFDEPFTDNLTLPDGHRFAITLKNVNAESRKATLQVFEFPEYYLPPGYNPSPDEVFKLIAHYQ